MWFEFKWGGRSHSGEDEYSDCGLEGGAVWRLAWKQKICMFLFFHLVLPVQTSSPIHFGNEKSLFCCIYLLPLAALRLSASAPHTRLKAQTKHPFLVGSCKQTFCLLQSFWVIGHGSLLSDYCNFKSNPRILWVAKMWNCTICLGCFSIRTFIAPPLS